MPILRIYWLRFPVHTSGDYTQSLGGRKDWSPCSCAESLVRVTAALSHIEEKFKGWICSQELMDRTNKGKYMHYGPAVRGQEVTDDVIDNETYSLYFEQVENRLHAQKAVMAMVIGDRSRAALAFFSQLCRIENLRKTISCGHASLSWKNSARLISLTEAVD